MEAPEDGGGHPGWSGAREADTLSSLPGGPAGDPCALKPAHMQPKITPPSLLPDPEAVGRQRNPLPPGIMSVPATTGNCPNVQQRGQISVPHALKMTL